MLGANMFKLGKKKATEADKVGIPPLVSDCIQFLEEKGLHLEGILRVSGRTEEVRNLRKLYEKGRAKVNLNQVEDPHSVAGLLKLYFRESPKPLLTFELYDEFIACAGISNEEECKNRLRDLISQLPIENQKTLHKLVLFLNRVAEFKAENKMDIANLAIVFAPSLLRKKVQNASDVFKDEIAVRTVVTFIITHQNSVFAIEEVLAASSTISEEVPTETESTEDPDELTLPDIDAEQEKKISALWNGYSPEIYSAFNKIASLSRTWNSNFEVPDICVIGKTGHGKTSFVEAFLGHPLTPVQEVRSTKRPLHISLLNNTEATVPQIKIKRDRAGDLLLFPEQEVPFDELGATIEQRNVDTTTPLYILYQSKGCFNCNIIDTPPVDFVTTIEEVPTPNAEGRVEDNFQEDEDAEKRADKLKAKWILEIARSSNIIILCFTEEVDDQMVEFAKKADPRLEKTIFVHTKFQSHLKQFDFISTENLNKYLQTSQSDAKHGAFFTTLLSDEDVAATKGSIEEFRTRLWQAEQLDLMALESLKYDKRFTPKIGIYQLRQYLLDFLWTTYREFLPEVPKVLKQVQDANNLNLFRVEGELNGLNHQKLRETANNCAMEWLQNVEKLMKGSLDGNPAQNGQTLAEEKEAKGVATWVDDNYEPIQFDPLEWHIPYWDTRLYGRQQFERVLAEFKAVADHRPIPEITLPEVATAAGSINLSKNVSEYIWVASDIAQQKIQVVFRPLIEQLYSRELYVLKRVAKIVDKMLKTKRKQESLKAQANRGPTNRLQTLANAQPSPRHLHHSPASTSGHSSSVSNSKNSRDFTDYPFFVRCLKDLYFNFVENQALIAKERCLEEFSSTRLLYWEATNLVGKKVSLDGKGPLEIKRSVATLATELFHHTRKRMTKNILLKFYEFLLIPVQSNLAEIQQQITYLSDPLLDELFQVHVLRDKYEAEQRLLRDKKSKLQQEEQIFEQAVQKFKQKTAAILTI